MQLGARTSGGAGTSGGLGIGGHRFTQSKGISYVDVTIWRYTSTLKPPYAPTLSPVYGPTLSPPNGPQLRDPPNAWLVASVTPRDIMSAAYILRFMARAPILQLKSSIPRIIGRAFR